MVFRKWALLHLAFAGILCFVGAADAQNPVSLSMSAKPAKAKVGDKITAQISASISGDWHMYSITQGAGGPIPTRITVAGGGAFKAAGGATGSAPRREMDPNFGIMTEFYAGSARFTVPVAVDASAQPGPQTLTVNVRYQVCNETLCLPPRTLKVSAPVEIVASSDALVIASPTPFLARPQVLLLLRRFHHPPPRLLIRIRMLTVLPVHLTDLLRRLRTQTRPI